MTTSKNRRGDAAARTATPRPHKDSLAPGRRGRPRLDEVAAINTAIVATARNMFLQEGYSSTSMEAVAKRAGVSKGTLYTRFPTKTELFNAVVEERVAAWSEESSRQNAITEGSTRERLEHLATVYLESMSRPEVRAFGRLLTAEAERFPELGRIYHKIGFQLAVNVIVKEIEAAAERDNLPVRNARTTAAMLMEMLFGYAALHGLLNRPLSLPERRRIASERVQLLLEGRHAW